MTTIHYIGPTERRIVCDYKWHSVVRFFPFILDDVFSVNTTCFVKIMVNACIAVTPIFQMIFQFPKPFFGSLFVGADAFDSESLAVRNTFGAMLRMTTLWGQVLMFICRFVDCMIRFSSFLMKMLAYEGAIFVPIAVALICQKCSPLNVKLLCKKYQCEQLDKTFRWWFINGSLIPGLSTCFDTVIVWNVSV